MCSEGVAAYRSCYCQFFKEALANGRFCRCVSHSKKEKRRKKHMEIYEKRRRKGIKYIEKRRKSIICWYDNSQNHVK